MKKLFFILLAMAGIGQANAQRNPAIPTTTDNIGVTVPLSISNKFNSDYPNMHAAWTLDGHNYRADYTDGTLDRSVTYDKNGKIINREEELAGNNYPAGIGSYCSQHNPNEQLEVWSKTDASGNKTYYTSRSAEVVGFDGNGKYKRTSKTGAPPKLEPTDY